MKDTQLYEQMLGLERPWEVESVVLDHANESLVVRTRCEKTIWVCPNARQKARVPRLKYPDGRTRMLEVSRAEGSSRFTALFERLAIDLLLACSVSEAGRILLIGRGAADAIKSRVVARGLLRVAHEVPRRICVDEKSYRKGHEYVTCVASVGYDGKARVVHVFDDRGQESLEKFFRRFEAMKDLSLKTGKAWSIKEVFREFLKSSYRPEAEACFKQCHQWACRCKLPAVEKVARMFKKPLSRILNYFDRKLSNGPIEGLNNKIQSLIEKAYGYRSRERFKTDIYFHLGGLNLFPA